MSTTRGPRSAAAGLVVGVLLVAGCSGNGHASHLDDQGAGAVSCLVHQPDRPGGDYAKGKGERTGAVLQLLRYYTANGTKTYCDKRGPTANDLAWARLYVDHGADPANVAAVLHSPAG